MTSAVVLTPAYTHVCPDLERVVFAARLPWMRLYGHSDLPRVRSVLIEQGLARGTERLILIDADTVAEPEALDALARSALVTPERAVWGMYPLREGDRWSVNPLDPVAADEAIRAGREFPIQTGGLGFCAIHRESLLRLGVTLPTLTEDTGTSWRPFCVPFVREGAYYADDGSLCVRLRESGTALWCDPRLRVGHAVTTVIRQLRG